MYHIYIHLSFYRLNLHNLHSWQQGTLVCVSERLTVKSVSKQLYDTRTQLYATKHRNLHTAVSLYKYTPTYILFRHK